MRILFTGSKVQECPSIIFALDRMGHQVALYPKKMEDIEENEEEGKVFGRFISKYKVDFVLSNIFTDIVADATNRVGVKYAVWCMDSPTYSTWIRESEYDNCYFFYFDYKEYELKRQSGKTNVYHLPLAADVVWGEKLVITDEEIKQYGCDMSFVGSLYTQNLYDKVIERFSANMQNVFSDIIEQSAFKWDGQDRLHVPPEVILEVKEQCPDIFKHPYILSDEYFIKTFLMGRKLSHVERTLIMELLSQRYNIHLYTRETEQVPEGVRRFPPIDAGSGALKVFYSSRINLNITLRSIASGIPARVFDVMSVGGFMLSNWQEEIPELFEEGSEIVTYKTPEELVDKADYYLRHDTERIRIGIGGYQKVKKYYTYEHQLDKLISILHPVP